jgi:hypothetical protein
MKSEKDVEEEQHDEEARKANATEYIARRIAEYARRRKNTRAKCEWSMKIIQRRVWPGGEPYTGSADQP